MNELYTTKCQKFHFPNILEYDSVVVPSYPLLTTIGKLNKEDGKMRRQSRCGNIPSNSYSSKLRDAIGVVYGKVLL